MSSVLMNIQQDIKQYVQKTATAFEVRMDVADENLIRIAGTGNFNNNIGLPLRVGQMFRKTMENRTIIFVKESKDSEHCCNCINLPICGNGARLYCPITFDQQVIGALSIIAESKQQNEQILNYTTRYFEYIKLVADWIALKVREYKNELHKKCNLELQQKLMNAINEGVMILNSKQQILYMNEHCECILGCNYKQIQYLAKNNMFSIHRKGSRLKNNLTDKVIYNVKIHDKTIMLDGYLYPVNNAENNEINSIYIFNVAETVQENNLKNENTANLTFRSLIGSSPVFINMIDQCKKVTYSENPILLAGEHGTGKNIVARTIHGESGFRNGMFISTYNEIDVKEREPVKESVFDLDQIWSNGELLQNSYLNGNTLYVDEVSNLKWESQQILLTIIKNRAGLRAKVICSTTADLKKQMEEGNFNPELYYALELFTIQIPSLRSRGNDINLFIDEFLKLANMRMQRNVRISKELRQMMLNYSWKGNLYELRNFLICVVDQAAYEDEEATSENIPITLLYKINNEKKDLYNLAESEKNLIIQALNDLEGKSYSKAHIAKELGIGVATLYRKMQEYGIHPNTLYK